MNLMEKEYIKYLTPDERIYYDAITKKWITNGQKFNNFIDAMAASSIPKSEFTPPLDAHQHIPGVLTSMFRSIAN